MFARILEMLAYCALVVALLSGILNYGFGISGYIEVVPGIKPVDISRYSLARGLFVGPSQPDMKIRVSELNPATIEKPSVLYLEVTNRKDRHMNSHRLETGENVRISRLKMMYLGDYYEAIVTVMKKKHDYRAVPVKLTFKQTNTGNKYTGTLYMWESGAEGEGEYEASSGLFRIKIYKEGELEFNGELPFAKPVKQGDFTVTVPAVRHAGKIKVTRYGYRNQVIGGIGAFVLFLVLRIIFRPLLVYLWSEGNRVYFYTRSRSIKRLLLKE
jgi:hypothetical protein